MAVYEDIDAIEIPDPLTVVFKLKAVNAAMLTNFASSWDCVYSAAKLKADPFSGCVFVFRSRRATSIKLLVYDGKGFWLATKRLSKGRFRWWPQSEDASKPLRMHQAQVLLAAGNPEVDAAPVWRPI